MPGRSFSSPSYRYGFNGKEKDDEVCGNGNQYDYGFRIYNPRLGKFLSADPLMKSYPWYTPYQFAGNSPIANVDLDGREEAWFYIELEKLIWGTNHIQTMRDGFMQRGLSTLTDLPQSIQAAKNISDFLGANMPKSLATNGNYAQTSLLINTFKTLLSETAQALIDDYKSLVQKAANGDDEAIGALAFEVLLLANDIKELEALKGFNPKWAKNLKGLHNIAEIRGDRLVFKTERAALRQIKKDLNIPANAKYETRMVELYDAKGNNIIGKNGKPVMSREQIYTLDDGTQYIIQDHTYGHPGYNVPGHFNVRGVDKGGQTIKKVVGAADHYYVK